MIDWVGIAANSVWIAGLAICLAVLSYRDWAAQATRAPASHPIILWVGLELFCLGCALSIPVGWQRALWAVLALAVAWAVRQKRQA